MPASQTHTKIKKIIKGQATNWFQCTFSLKKIKFSDKLDNSCWWKQTAKTLLSRKNRLLAAEAQRLFIAHVAKKKRSREVTYCHIPRVSELKERRCLEAAKEARHFKGISLSSWRAARFQWENIAYSSGRERGDGDNDDSTECIRDVSHFLWRARVCRKQETDLRKVEKERATHAHIAVKEKGYRRRRRGRRKKEREGDGGRFIPRALSCQRASF